MHDEVIDWLDYQARVQRDPHRRAVLQLYAEIARSGAHPPERVRAAVLARQAEWRDRDLKG